MNIATPNMEKALFKNPWLLPEGQVTFFKQDMSLEQKMEHKTALEVLESMKKKKLFDSEPLYNKPTVFEEKGDLFVQHCGRLWTLMNKHHYTSEQLERAVNEFLGIIVLEQHHHFKVALYEPLPTLSYFAEKESIVTATFEEIPTMYMKTLGETE